jgi:hypothetical protein
MSSMPGSPAWNLVDQPAVDVQSIIESVNASVRESMEQALKARARVVPKPVLPTDFVDQMQQLRRQRLPQNWPASLSAKLWAARSIIEAEGIPLVYVPRADVVGMVFEAASREERVTILLAHQDEILDDCDGALTVDLHSYVKGQVPLVRQAVASYRSGHVAASQALSVVVCDTLVRANVAAKHTTAKATAAGADLKQAIMADILRVELALAPVVKLLTEWSPEGGKPEPNELSRHVTVHHATDAHLREDNALVAVMLATSLIRGFSEMHEWFDARAS